MSFKVYTGQGDGHSPGGYYRAPAASKIEPQSEESLERWQQSLRLSRAELLEAIKLFGVDPRDIRRGLLQKKSA